MEHKAGALVYDAAGPEEEQGGSGVMVLFLTSLLQLQTVHVNTHTHIPA